MKKMSKLQTKLFLKEQEKTLMLETKLHRQKNNKYIKYLKENKVFIPTIGFNRKQLLLNTKLCFLRRRSETLYY